MTATDDSRTGRGDFSGDYLKPQTEHFESTQK